MTQVRVRYAPSPTGSPHVGNIRTALFDWLFARHSGGKFILRIEDTDKNREVPNGIQEQLDTLAWYGLDYDEGPGVGGDYGPYVQSERLSIYHEHAERLIAEGKAYRAYDTEERLKAMREDQQRRGLPTGYDRRHRFLTPEERKQYEDSGTPSVVRIAIPLEGKTVVHDAVYGDVTFEHRVLDDQILLKSDGYPTYGLASVVDDHLMKISHVFRGEEWIPSAPIHQLTYEAFGWEPPVFVHLPLMLGPDKKKFGKRNGALAALEYPKAGFLQEAMFNFLALQGWSAKEERDLYTREELVEKFNLSGLINHSPISDPEKLLWFNGQYIRSLSNEDLVKRSLPFLQESGMVAGELDEESLTYLSRVIALERDRIKTLAEVPALADFFLLPDDAITYDEKAVAKWFGHPGVKERIQTVRSGIAELTEFNAETIEAVVRAAIAQYEVKPGEIIHPLRVSVSGRTTGPGLFELIDVLGKDRVDARLARAESLMTG